MSLELKLSKSGVDCLSSSDALALNPFIPHKYNFFLAMKLPVMLGVPFTSDILEDRGRVNGKINTKIWDHTYFSVKWHKRGWKF